MSTPTNQPMFMKRSLTGERAPMAINSPQDGNPSNGNKLTRKVRLSLSWKQIKVINSPQDGNPSNGSKLTNCCLVFKQSFHLKN